MSHFAELDNNNKVIRVLVGDNNDPAGDEGYKWLLDNLGGTWIKTSYNGNMRYNYAGIGYSYDADADAFIAPKPECGHTELQLNDKYQWKCNNREHEVNLNADNSPKNSN
jgi:hypothetical protein